MTSVITYDKFYPQYVFDGVYAGLSYELILSVQGHDTNAEALVFSARLGLRRRMSDRLHLALWAGAMRQEVSEFLVGEAIGQGFAFLVAQGPVAPWNALIGGRLEIGEAGHQLAGEGDFG